MKRNLVILFVCQLIAISGSIVAVTLGGIFGSRLAPTPVLATLPVSLMIVGTALTTVPAALLMRAIGRARGFSLAALCSCGGMVLFATALAHSNFVLLCSGYVMMGTNLAFVQQYRFAAAESVASAHVGRAISLVLFGSIGGALLGPEIVKHSQAWFGGDGYRGALFILAGMALLASVLMLALRTPPPADTGPAPQPARPLRETVSQPLFLTAVLGGVVAYGVMTFVMTATPVSMRIIDGHTMSHTIGVVRSHVISMYAPSLISGFLIERLGVRRMMAAGALAMLGTVIAGLQGHAVMHYWIALVLLGVGWNFLYVGATTQLTRTYRPSERFRAQAVNDFSVFAISATGSLLAGTAIHLLGWFKVMLIVTVPLATILTVLYATRRMGTADVR